MATEVKKVPEQPQPVERSTEEVIDVFKGNKLSAFSTPIGILKKQADKIVCIK